MSNPVWVVKSVVPQDDYTLLLTFESGEKKKYDASPLLEKKMYDMLKNRAFFMMARVECGTVVWNDDIDIAPEDLYEFSTAV